MDAETQKAVDKWVEDEGWKFKHNEPGSVLIWKLRHYHEPDSLDALCGYNPGGARTRVPENVDCPKCLVLMTEGCELDVLAGKKACFTSS